MAALLLDTHIALWLDSGSSELRQATVSTIEQTRGAGGVVYLSGVSAWEIAMLQSKDRIRLDLPVPDWIRRFLQRQGVHAVPLDWPAAAHAYEPQPFLPDPVDRLLMATAIELGCPLVTYDRAILDFGRRYGGQYRLQVTD